MKKYLFLALTSILLLSCSTNNDKDKISPSSLDETSIIETTTSTEETTENISTSQSDIRTLNIETKGWNFTPSVNLSDKNKELLAFFNSFYPGFFSAVSTTACFSQSMITEKENLGETLTLGSSKSDGQLGLVSNYEIKSIEITCQARFAYDDYNKILRYDEPTLIIDGDSHTLDATIDGGQTKINVFNKTYEMPTKTIGIQSQKRIFINNIAIKYIDVK